MGLLAVFGIENDGLNLAVNLLLLFLVVVWLALVYWTFADARRRIADPLLVGCATAASLFPFVGTIVYLIVRPPEYLADVRERNLEIAAAQARLDSVEHLHCQYCGFEVEKAFLRCPSCLRRLKEPCTVVQQAARPALEDLPVLRGRGRPGAGDAQGPAQTCRGRCGRSSGSPGITALGLRAPRARTPPSAPPAHSASARRPRADPPRATPPRAVRDPR